MTDMEDKDGGAPRGKRRVLLVGGIAGGAALTVLLLLFNPRRAGLGGAQDLRPAAELVKAAEAALKAIPTPENRRARRPVGFDDVLVPVDGLIELARARLREERDAVAADQPELPSPHLYAAADLAHDAARLAAAGLAMARSDPVNPRTQRFPDQIADALLAGASAEFVLWRRAAEAGDGAAPTLLESLRRDLDKGLEQRPTDKDLLRLSANTDQRLGLWPAAAKSLETAVLANPGFAEGWNDLGVVRIMTRDNAGAEQAFIEAQNQSRPAPGEAPSEIYQSATYNLASFHANLSTYFNHEHARTGADEARQEATRHRNLAQQAYGEYLRDAPPEEGARIRSEISRLGPIEP